VRRVIEDAFAEERAYYARRRIFPIMHVVVIKNAILEQYPWVARNVVDAFERAKQVAYRRLANPRRLPLVWFQETWEEQARLFDGDPFPYTVEANRSTLQTFLRYALEQRLIAQPIRVEDLFPPTVQEPMPQYWAGYEH
jgi:4,5-dihydroxyphthalate decarboxylase